MRKVVRRPERHDARPDGSLDRRRRYRRSSEIGQPPSGEKVLALSDRTVSPGFIAGGACGSVSERSPSTLLLISRELRCAVTVQFPKLICPTWQETYFAIVTDSPLNLSGKSKVKFRPSCSARGASAVVTNVGAGCGGRGSVGRAMLSAGWVGPHERTRGTRRRALKRPRGKFRPAAHEPGRDASREGSCGRQKRVVLAPVAGVKPAKMRLIQPDQHIVNSPATEARRIRLRGERAISR